MRDPLVDPAPLVRRVYAYVAYRIGDGPDAEDVTSETFERALRYRDSFDARRGTPAAWLIGIARRCLADRAGRSHELVSEPPEEASNEELEVAAVRRLEVQRAVGSLDERSRELIALRYGADLTTAQIGELLELKTNAVEVALHRALHRLESALDGEPEPRRRAREVPDIGRAL
ncbi:MAG TPA: sigma-70 family RNA polymerase sigma factor [Gaiellaceae bacterium]